MTHPVVFEDEFEDEKEYLTVNIEEIEGMAIRRAQINSIPLNRITFLKDGRMVHINKDVKDKFDFTGLNNIDFITSGYYLLEDWPGTQGHV